MKARSLAGLALSLLASCSTGWGDVPGARICAEVPSDPAGAALAWWGPEVQAAADRWAELLGAGCPPPFVYAAGAVDGGMPAHPIRLIAERDWTWGPGVWGNEQDGAGGAVDVRSSLDRPGRHMVLMHELGHALGLDHRPTSEQDALMRPYPTVDTPNASEIAEARALLGCPS